jgi:hypothetical protein
MADTLPDNPIYIELRHSDAITGRLPVPIPGKPGSYATKTNAIVQLLRSDHRISIRWRTAAGEAIAQKYELPGEISHYFYADCYL